MLEAMSQTPEERTLQMLEEREGCRVVATARYNDKEAYVFIQDTPDGVRSYGYCVPRENGESWAYFPQKDTYMKSEAEIIKIVTKGAIQLFQDEKKEVLTKVEGKFTGDNEDTDE